MCTSMLAQLWRWSSYDDAENDGHWTGFCDSTRIINHTRARQRDYNALNYYGKPFNC